MAKITRIKAKDPAQSEDSPKKVKKEPVAAKSKEKEPEKAPEKVEKTKNPEKKSEKNEKTKKIAKKTEKKAKKEEKPLKKVFILARPFVALGRYLRDSWRELRQVRWPNRKAAWKMTLAVLVYCAIFMAFIALLDMLFTLLFNTLLG